MSYIQVIPVYGWKNALETRGTLEQGTYRVGDGDLDFYGELRPDAKFSQTITGAKSALLKAIDPFRGKNSGAKIPVKVNGTKDHPSFGIGHE